MNKFPPKKSLRARALLAGLSCFVFGSLSPLHGAHWKGSGTGGDGEWNAASNWDTLEVPGGSTDVYMRLASPYTDPAAEITVDSSAPAKFNFLYVRRGKAVTLALKAGASLSGSIMTVGEEGRQDGTGSQLTIKGPTEGAAAVTLERFYVKYDTGLRNSLTLSGSGLTVNLTKNYTDINNGGSLIVTDGATVNAQTGTAFYLQATGSNGLNNRVALESGTVSVPTIYMWEGSLFQLSKNATLTASNIYVNRLADAGGARFEAEGAGLTGMLKVYSKGVLAIGLTDVETNTRSAASKLTIQSTVEMDSGSILEVHVFGSGADGIDQINLAEGGSLKSGGTGAVLKLKLEGYTPKAGESWTLFTGETGSISGVFDFSEVDTNLWDISQLNADGEWVITAIPEPSSLSIVSMVGLIGTAFAGFLKRSSGHRSSADK